MLQSFEKSLSEVETERGVKGNEAVETKMIPRVAVVFAIAVETETEIEAETGTEIVNTEIEAEIGGGIGTVEIEEEIETVEVEVVLETKRKLERRKFLSLLLLLSQCSPPQPP